MNDLALNNNTATKTVSKKRGFSLVEVVVAIGIFAIAIVGVIGLLAPTSQSISQVIDSDDASRVVTAVQGELQRLGYSYVNTYVLVNSSGSDAAKILYATKDGLIIGVKDAKNSAGDEIWTGTNHKFFKIEVIRNTDLSPTNNDTTAGYLAFTLSIRWPAFAVQEYEDSTQDIEVTDSTQQEVMIVPMAITR